MEDRHSRGRLGRGMEDRHRMGRLCWEGGCILGLRGEG